MNLLHHYVVKTNILICKLTFQDIECNIYSNMDELVYSVIFEFQVVNWWNPYRQGHESKNVIGVDQRKLIDSEIILSSTISPGNHIDYFIRNPT